MTDYNLVSTGTADWLTPDLLGSALTEAFPGTELRGRELLPAAPVDLWAYVPDGPGRTGEVALNRSGRMVAFTDASRPLVARIVVELARRRPPPDGELQLWRWAREPVTVTGDTEEAELLAADEA